jgi:hypothetical protein
MVLNSWLSITYKNFRKLLFLGNLREAKPYYQGGWEK